MATSVGSSVVNADTLEVGCLHVGLIGARNVRVGGGGMVDLFLNPQANPYCKITLGDCQFTSGIGVKTAVGYAWNREQMFFPVKVPLSCVLGVSGQRDPLAGHGGGGSLAAKAKRGCSDNGVVCCRGAAPGKRAGGQGGHASCLKGGAAAFDDTEQPRGSSAAEVSPVLDAWSRLTLRAQVFHLEGAGAAATSRPVQRAQGSASRAPNLHTHVSNNSDNKQTGLTCLDDPATNEEDTGGSGSGDRLLGECSINLVEVVSGRVPHMEEWVPLNTEGDLRLSLDYDSVGCPPVPGDSVVLLCLSNQLDFFPLPVWDMTDDSLRPGSPSWLWSYDASQRLPRRGGAHAVGKAGEGFRVEEAGDDFFLISYSTPAEGWRCAVEVHRFLVYPDPTAPRRWTLSGLRDHAIATPAAAALRSAVLHASQEESFWGGATEVVARVVEGVKWTACRWLDGGLGRIRDDVMFAVGLMDCDAFTQSEEDRHRGREEEKNETQERESEDDGSSSRRHSIDMSKGRPDGIPPEGGPAARNLNALDSAAEENCTVSAPSSATLPAVPGGAGGSSSQNGAELQGHRLGDWDDQGFTERKNCEEAIPKAGSPDRLSFLEGADSPDSMINSGVLAPVSYLVKEAESVSGVIGDEHHKHTTKKDAEESKGAPASLKPVSVAPAESAVLLPRDEPPQHLCPITKCPMEDPAVASDGYTYER